MDASPFAVAAASRREPLDQYRDKLKRLFAFGPSTAPSVDLVQIGSEWTSVHGVEGITGRDVPLPEGCEHADDVSLTLFVWDGRFPAHVHEQQETIHVLHGAIEVLVEGSRHIVRSGDAITIGAMVEHSGHTIEPAVIICAYHPPLPFAP